jgi:2-polyprenyl-6-methoxyphenol hydroxylase-like FAD-dependent oxidoreductase
MTGGNNMWSAFRPSAGRQSPCQSAVKVGLRAGRCFGTPIAKYVPTRLIAGHMALIGDAAHVSSPITGGGFHYALLDVLSLRQVFAGVADGEAVAPALAQFERARQVAFMPAAVDWCLTSRVRCTWS